jgi:hypothetical protein
MHVPPGPASLVFAVKAGGGSVQADAARKPVAKSSKGLNDFIFDMRTPVSGQHFLG